MDASDCPILHGFVAMRALPLGRRSGGDSNADVEVKERSTMACVRDFIQGAGEMLRKISDHPPHAPPQTPSPVDDIKSDTIPVTRGKCFDDARPPSPPPPNPDTPSFRGSVTQEAGSRGVPDGLGFTLASDIADGLSCSVPSKETLGRPSLNAHKRQESHRAAPKPSLARSTSRAKEGGERQDSSDPQPITKGDEQKRLSQHELQEVADAQRRLSRILDDIESQNSLDVAGERFRAGLYAMSMASKYVADPEVQRQLASAAMAGGQLWQGIRSVSEGDAVSGAFTIGGALLAIFAGIDDDDHGEIQARIQADRHAELTRLIHTAIRVICEAIHCATVTIVGEVQTLKHLIGDCHSAVLLRFLELRHESADTYRRLTELVTESRRIRRDLHHQHDVGVRAAEGRHAELRGLFREMPLSQIDQAYHRYHAELASTPTRGTIDGARLLRIISRYHGFFTVASRLQSFSAPVSASSPPAECESRFCPFQQWQRLELLHREYLDRPRPSFPSSPFFPPSAPFSSTLSSSGSLPSSSSSSSSSSSPSVSSSFSSSLSSSSGASSSSASLSSSSGAPSSFFFVGSLSSSSSGTLPSSPGSSLASSSTVPSSANSLSSSSHASSSSANSHSSRFSNAPSSSANSLSSPSSTFSSTSFSSEPLSPASVLLQGPTPTVRGVGGPVHGAMTQQAGVVSANMLVTLQAAHQLDLLLDAACRRDTVRAGYRQDTGRGGADVKMRQLAEETKDEAKTVPTRGDEKKMGPSEREEGKEGKEKENGTKRAGVTAHWPAMTLGQKTVAAQLLRQMCDQLGQDASRLERVVLPPVNRAAVQAFVRVALVYQDAWRTIEEQRRATSLLETVLVTRRALGQRAAAQAHLLRPPLFVEYRKALDEMDRLIKAGDHELWLITNGGKCPREPFRRSLRCPEPLRSELRDGGYIINRVWHGRLVDSAAQLERDELFNDACTTDTLMEERARQWKSRFASAVYRLNAGDTTATALLADSLQLARNRRWETNKNKRTRLVRPAIDHGKLRWHVWAKPVARQSDAFTLPLLFDLADVAGLERKASSSSSAAAAAAATWWMSGTDVELHPALYLALRGDGDVQCHYEVSSADSKGETLAPDRLVFILSYVDARTHATTELARSAALAPHCWPLRSDEDVSDLWYGGRHCTPGERVAVYHPERALALYCDIKGSTNARFALGTTLYPASAANEGRRHQLRQAAWAGFDASWSALASQWHSVTANIEQQVRDEMRHDARDVRTVLGALARQVDDCRSLVCAHAQLHHGRLEPLASFANLVCTSASRSDTEFLNEPDALERQRECLSRPYALAEAAPLLIEQRGMIRRFEQWRLLCEQARTQDDAEKLATSREPNAVDVSILDELRQLRNENAEMRAQLRQLIFLYSSSSSSSSSSAHQNLSPSSLPITTSSASLSSSSSSTRSLLDTPFSSSLALSASPASSP